MVRKVQKVASGKTRITFSRSDFHKNLSAVESHVEKIWTPLIIEKKKEHLKKSNMEIFPVTNHGLI